MLKKGKFHTVGLEFYGDKNFIRISCSSSISEGKDSSSTVSVYTVFLIKIRRKNN